RKGRARPQNNARKIIGSEAANSMVAGRERKPASRIPAAYNNATSRSGRFIAFTSVWRGDRWPKEATVPTLRQWCRSERRRAGLRDGERTVDEIRRLRRRARRRRGRDAHRLHAMGGYHCGPVFGKLATEVARARHIRSGAPLCE